MGVKDPNKTGSGTKYRQREIYEYGNNVKYTLLSTGLKYEPTNNAASGTTSYYTSFAYYDETSKIWKGLVKNGSVTLRSTLYQYYPTTLKEINDKNATVGIGVNTTEYKMLFTNSSTGADKANAGKTDNILYWLDSSYVHTNVGYASFGLFLVSKGYVDCDNLYSDGIERRSLLWRASCSFSGSKGPAKR